MTLSIWE